MQNYNKATGRSKILPEKRTILGLWFSTWLWTFVIRLIIIALFKPNFKILFFGWTPEIGFMCEMIVALIIYSAYYFYFIENNRFNDIYVEYKLTDAAAQKQGVKKVSHFLVLPLVLIPLMTWLIIKYLNIDLANH